MQKETMANTSDVVTEAEGLPKPAEVGRTDGGPERGAPLLLFMENWRGGTIQIIFSLFFLIQHGGIYSILGGLNRRPGSTEKTDRRSDFRHSLSKMTHGTCFSDTELPNL